MAHNLSDRQKLLNRVRKLKGQVDAVERSLVADAPCAEVMRLVATVKGATVGLMAEVVNQHVRSHMIDANRAPSAAETAAAEELVAVLKTYIA